MQSRIRLALLLGWTAAASTATLVLAAGATAVAAGGADAAEAVATVGAAGAAAAAAPSMGEISAGISDLLRHPEPANALSLPTCVIHVSSLIEWLVTMGLIWEYADASGNPKYKGLTWAMVPCHASGGVVQVQTRVKFAWLQRLILKCDVLLSSVGFKFNLRHCTAASRPARSTW